MHHFPLSEDWFVVLIFNVLIWRWDMLHCQLITEWQGISKLAFRGNNGQKKIEHNQKRNAI